MKLTEQMEQLNIVQSAENTDKKESNLIEYEQVENTPFTIVTQEGKHFGTLGNHRITEITENKEKLKEELNTFSWDRITQVIWAVVEKLTEKK